MRNRFRPNITPRGSRSSTSSGGTSNRPTESSTETQESINKGPQSITEQSNATANASEKDAEAESEKQASLEVGKTTSKNLKDSSTGVSETAVPPPSESKAPVRRSRLKPSVKPVSRPRASTRPNKEVADDTVSKTTEKSAVKTATDIVNHKNITEEITKTLNSESRISTVETSVTTASEAKRNNEAKSQPEAPFIPPRVMAAIPPRAMSVSTNIVQNVNQAPETPVAGASNSSLISRRKRALPNLVGASRRRRTASVSKDATEKATHPEEATVNSAVDQALREVTAIQINDAGAMTCTAEQIKRARLSSESENIKPSESVLSESVASTEEVVTEKQTGDGEVEEPVTKKGEEKKKRHIKVNKSKEPFDPSKMTLQDLIYYNPSENPMKSKVDTKRKRGGKKENKEISDPPTDSSTKSTDAKNKSASQSSDLLKSGGATDQSVGGEETVALAPQIKIAADGSIILDEESLLIRSSPRETLEESEIVYEDCNNVNYAAYLKNRKIGRWSLPETLKFYKALSQVGTDFSLMGALFPKRKRKELKAKFKREEKFHRDLVDRALEHRLPIDIEQFMNPTENAEDPDEPDEPDPKAKQTPKRRKGSIKSNNADQENVEV